MTNNIQKEAGKSADLFAVSELFFVFLPLIVVFITFCSKGTYKEILRLPEWSILASVMFGQSIVRNNHAIMNMASIGKINTYKFNAVTTVIIILGLVPSLTILTLIFITDILPVWIYVTQILLFVGSCILFYFANGVTVYVDGINKHA
jgi:hypothetical protein